MIWRLFRDSAESSLELVLDMITNLLWMLNGFFPSSPLTSTRPTTQTLFLIHRRHHRQQHPKQHHPSSISPRLLPHSSTALRLTSPRASKLHSPPFTGTRFDECASFLFCVLHLATVQPKLQHQGSSETHPLIGFISPENSLPILRNPSGIPARRQYFIFPSRPRLTARVKHFSLALYNV